MRKNPSLGLSIHLTHLHKNKFILILAIATAPNKAGTKPTPVFPPYLAIAECPPDSMHTKQPQTQKCPANRHPPSQTFHGPDLSPKSIYHPPAVLQIL